MKSVLGILTLCICVAFTSCEEEALPIEPSSLYSEWTHAYEEQAEANSSQMIFRISGDQTFAPSRFRQSYVFNTDGSCSYLFLDPADAHHFRPGTFEYNSQDKTLSIFDQDGAPYDRFEVLELEADKLVLQRQ